MSIRKNSAEIARLTKAFEEAADSFLDISFGVFVIASDFEPPSDKFTSPNHMITLWQYYGVVASDEDRERLMRNMATRDPQWGMRGAKLSLAGVVQGEATPLFVRMAKRAGSLFSRKEVDAFKIRLLDDILDKEATPTGPGKPVGSVNSNPLAIWLNYLLYYLSLPRLDVTSLVVIDPDPFTLSLLALENLQLKSQVSRSDKSATPLSQIHFRVSMSFPGEHRKYVAAVVEAVREQLGEDSVFYDLDYQAQLARPNLDTLLQEIYRNRSDLVVVFLSSEYQNKEWCGLEWRAIREIVKERQDDRVMLIRFDDTKIDGIFTHDGYIDARTHTEAAVANFVLNRLNSLGS